MQHKPIPAPKKPALIKTNPIKNKEAVKKIYLDKYKSDTQTSDTNKEKPTVFSLSFWKQTFTQVYSSFIKQINYCIQAINTAKRQFMLYSTLTLAYQWLTQKTVLGWIAHNFEIQKHLTNTLSSMLSKKHNNAARVFSDKPNEDMPTHSSYRAK